MPKVSVVILNWNGKKFLEKCLKSLQQVSYRPLEIIVVDNNSTDGSPEFVSQNFPDVKLVKNHRNVGFAAGNNLGYKVSTGKYIVFLNNDTLVTRDFLDLPIKNLEQNTKLGCIQPQMRILGNTKLIDQVGSYLTSTGYLYHFGFKKPYRQKKYQLPRDIFSAKGACMIMPRRVLKKVGLFDEDFFIFFEETDLCFRVWLTGLKVRYEPQSVIYHQTGGDTEDTYTYERRIYLSTKNMLCSYLKNFGLLNLATILPILILVQFVIILIFLMRKKPRASWAMVRGYFWNVGHLRSTLKKRTFVQKEIRKVSDLELRKYILYNPQPTYYYYLLTNLQKYQDL